ncbi:hypothetical protein OSB04_014732 [Centaurea solstitialis]|uniref:Major facilitator superfamily (MFS) profile domain-containing protein n=1 Tax=Centaurea solstitialis TaxID=347529 RepID=A0AA38W6Q4_9ASTR|nr:hypothetical protein OSB04_014732 [Centaurea solstitialis]
MNLCSSATSVGGWTAVPPPEITFPASSSYFSRQFKSTSPYLIENRSVISHRNGSSFVVKQSSNPTASQEREGPSTIEEPTFKDNRVGNEGVGYTLDEALSTIGFGNFQFIVLAYAGLGWVAEAMEMMLLSFVGPALQPEWDFLPVKRASFQPSLLLACSSVHICGALFQIFTEESNRNIFLAIQDGFSWCIYNNNRSGNLSAFAPNYTSFLILRCFIGVGLGCGHVFTSWFLEFVPTPKRGTWMVVFATFWTVGTIIEASLAWSIMPNFGWRWLLGLSAVPSLLLILFYDHIPESPRYLCTKGRLTETRNILEKGAMLNQKELPIGMLVFDQTDEANNERRSLKTTDSHRSSTTLPLWFLYFGNTFSYYGIVLLTSQLSISHSECGVIALQPETIQDSSLYTNVFITSLAGTRYGIISELPGLGLAAIILDKLGRKTSMEILFFAGFLLLLPLVVHQNEIMTTTFLFGARMFVSASFIVACIYAPEYTTYSHTVSFTLGSTDKYTDKYKGDGRWNSDGYLGEPVAWCALLWQLDWLTVATKHLQTLPQVPTHKDCIWYVGPDST